MLQKELEHRGVKVSERTVRRFVARFQTEQPAKPVIPKVRDVIALVTTHPDKRTANDTVLLKELCSRCPDLELLCAQVRRFAAILLTRPGAERLAEWIDQAQSAALKETAAFTAGLLTDWNAVAAAVTLKWNSVSTEGQVNRIKILKRQMFGRAKPDLLRKRVLARTRGPQVHFRAQRFQCVECWPVRLIDSDGHGVELGVAGYQLPDAIEPQHRQSWLIIEGTAHSPEGTWSFRWQALTADDAVELARWLTRTASEPSGASNASNHLAFTEPNLAFALASTDSSLLELRVGLDLEFSPPWRRHVRSGDPFEVTCWPTPESVLNAATAWAAEIKPYPPASATIEQ